MKYCWDKVFIILMGGVRLLIIPLQIARRLEPTLPLDLKKCIMTVLTVYDSFNWYFLVYNETL